MQTVTVQAVSGTIRASKVLASKKASSSSRWSRTAGVYAEVAGDGAIRLEWAYHTGLFAEHAQDQLARVIAALEAKGFSVIERPSAMGNQTELIVTN